MRFKTDRDVAAVNEDVQMTTGRFIILYSPFTFTVSLKLELNMLLT